MGAAIIWPRARPKNDIVYRVYRKGRLGPIEIVSEKSRYPRTAVSTDGVVHLIYHESDPYAGMSLYKKPPSWHKRHVFYRRWKEGEWSIGEEVAKNVFLDSPSIHIDDQNRIHLFWVEFVDGKAQLVHTLARASRAERGSCPPKLDGAAEPVAGA